MKLCAVQICRKAMPTATVAVAGQSYVREASSTCTDVLLDHTPCYNTDT